MPVKLVDLAREWDRKYEADLPEVSPGENRQPYTGILHSLNAVAPLRFQPYQNDSNPVFMEKLKFWIEQFPSSEEKRVAFLLAANVVFVTRQQFEAMQRELFTGALMRHLLDAVILRDSLPALAYATAAKSIDEEMDRTVFVENSDSSNLNSFTHVNKDYFHHKSHRRLTAPEVSMWTYPAEKSSADPASCSVVDRFESDVLGKDLRGKDRMVVLEDFSGTGSDLLSTLNLLSRSNLPIQEILIAPVITTNAAAQALRNECGKLTASSDRTYRFMCRMVLPDRYSCFDGPSKSYLADSAPDPNISAKVRQLSSAAYTRALHKVVNIDNQHGFGKLALAFAFFSNCPDNSLPSLWANTDGWRALFSRASRII